MAITTTITTIIIIITIAGGITITNTASGGELALQEGASPILGWGPLRLRRDF